MNLDTVTFGLDGTNYPRTFDRSRLALGSPIFVTTGADGEPSFSLDAGVGTRLVHVAWISPSDWWVELLGPPSAAPQEIEAVLKWMRPSISHEVVQTAAAKSLDKMDPELAYVTAKYKDTEWSRLRRVASRLDVCEQLKSPDVGKALFFNWASTVEYHLLTCFDLLGQPDGWLPFGDWLKSKKPEHVAEVEEVHRVASEAGDDWLKLTDRLVREHNARFGVRSAFYRFLREVLSPEAREELLQTIWIVRRSNPPSVRELPDGNDQDKEGYLFRLRNEYTHDGLVRSGVHPQLTPAIPGFPSIGDTWLGREQEVCPDKWITIFTRGWPGALRRAVVAGMKRRVEALANLDG